MIEFLAPTSNSLSHGGIVSRFHLPLSDCMQMTSPEHLYYTATVKNLRFYTNNVQFTINISNTFILHLQIIIIIYDVLICNVPILIK